MLGRINHPYEGLPLKSQSTEIKTDPSRILETRWSFEKETQTKGRNKNLLPGKSGLLKGEKISQTTFVSFFILPDHVLKIVRISQTLIVFPV